MKNKRVMAFRILAVLSALSVLNSGCNFLDTVFRALGRVCEMGEFTVTRTDDPSADLCDGTNCSLRQAISMSNACPGVQTIRVQPGEYELHLEPVVADDLNRVGDFDITDSVNLIGEGRVDTEPWGPGDQLFEIMEGATVNMTNLGVNGFSAGALSLLNHGTLNATQVRFTGGIVNQGTAAFSHSRIQSDRTVPLRNQPQARATLDNVAVGGGYSSEYAIVNDPTAIMQITYSTILGHSAVQISNEGAMMIDNSIVFAGIGDTCSSPLISLGFNLESSDACGFHRPGDWVAIDPLIGNGSDGDGDDSLFSLQRASPAIDSADPSRCGGTDMRGLARPQSIRCDRGAMESPFPPLYPLVRVTIPSVPLVSEIPPALETPFTPSPIILVLSKNANCRHGPGTVYPVLTSVLQGQQVQLIGRNADNTWWLGLLPGDYRCWISNAAGVPDGDPNRLAVLADPPTPTPTSEPAQAPTDFDKDGYPAGKDCNDKDDKVHPGAPEGFNDSIDSNCNGDPNT